jgi:hypothetical protein
MEVSGRWKEVAGAVMKSQADSPTRQQGKHGCLWVLAYEEFPILRSRHNESLDRAYIVRRGYWSADIDLHSSMRFSERSSRNVGKYQYGSDFVASDPKQLTTDDSEWCADARIVMYVASGPKRSFFLVSRAFSWAGISTAESGNQERRNLVASQCNYTQ